MLLLCLMDNRVLLGFSVISFIYYVAPMNAGKKLTYNYDELLKRARAQVPEVTLKKERLELPRLYVTMVGMRTTIGNFKEISDTLDRDPQHILKFLTREMATAATYHDGRAIFQGKFPRDTFERLLQRYMEGFVTCPVCKRPDTKIVKEKRLSFTVCNACGAKSSIKQL
jgi:translation initiation factor 2 subunit 2